MLELTSGLPADIGRWVCIEWLVTPGSMTMWIDDAIVSGLDDVAWTTPASANRVSLGLQYTSGDAAPIDLWLDEVIVDSAPIGCTK